MLGSWFECSERASAETFTLKRFYQEMGSCLGQAEELCTVLVSAVISKNACACVLAVFV